MKQAWDVVVIGAGPAGLLAAGRAAMLGARVLLLEKMEKPARKLRITGKGRANITNMKPVEEHLREIHPEPRFLRQAYEAFFNRAPFARGAPVPSGSAHSRIGTPDA